MMTLLGKALAYTLFYSCLVYLPLRLIVDVACTCRLRAARKKAEQARKVSRARTA